MPKDNPQLAKSYPTVRSALMFNPYGTPDYKRAETERRKATDKAASQAAKEAAKLALKKKKLKPPTPLPVIYEEVSPKADPFAALRAVVTKMASERKSEIEFKLS